MIATRIVLTLNVSSTALSPGVGSESVAASTEADGTEGIGAGNMGGEDVRPGGKGGAEPRGGGGSAENTMDAGGGGGTDMRRGGGGTDARRAGGGGADETRGSGGGAGETRGSGGADETRGAAGVAVDCDFCAGRGGAEVALGASAGAFVGIGGVACEPTEGFGDRGRLEPSCFTFDEDPADEGAIDVATAIMFSLLARAMNQVPFRCAMK